MAVYGIGCTYDAGDVSQQFFDRGIVCIGWDENQKQYYQGLFQSIETGDIIVMKSLDRQGQRLIIKGVGIVSDNTIKTDDEFGLSIAVEWLNYDPDGLKEIHLTGDGGVQRNTTIYKEHNKEYIKEIIGLMKD